MKRFLTWAVPILIVLVSVGILWFLHLFTVVDQEMTYIDWTAAVRLDGDGQEEPLDLTSYSDQTELSGIYRFTGELPQGLPAGYLLFETSGAAITLSLNSQVLWESSAAAPEGSMGMSQATIPLPPDPSGTLVMTCEILDGQNILFPPLLRFLPDTLNDTQSAALANHTALPTGAAALGLLLIIALFFVSLRFGKADLTLLPLALAALGLTLHPISLEQGAFFLPDRVSSFLGNPRFSLLIPLALLVYLLLNRRRNYWKNLLLITLWSAGALLIAYLFSLLRDGYLATYLNSIIPSLFQFGFYEGPAHWFTLWLTLVCAFLSACGAARAFSEQAAMARELTLKNQLILKDYQSIEQRLDAKNSLLHEWNHQLTALDCLYEAGDYSGIKTLIDQLKQDSADTRTDFSANITYNAILNEMSERAIKAGIRLETELHLPAKLPIPESDLCTLLLNMLENALEACEKVTPPEKRRISFRSGIEKNYLTIYCENTFQGEILETRKGRLLSTKKDGEGHGYGLDQMSAVVRKYHSILDVHYTEDGLFIVQTALRLPEA